LFALFEYATMSIRSFEEVEEEALSWRVRLQNVGAYSPEVLNPLQTWLAQDDRHGPALRCEPKPEAIRTGPSNDPTVPNVPVNRTHTSVTVRRPVVPPPEKGQLTDPRADVEALAWQWALWRWFAPGFDERRRMEAVLEAWVKRDPCHAKSLYLATSTLIGYLRLKSRHIQMQAATPPVPDVTQLAWQEIVALLQAEAATAKAIRILRQQSVPEWASIRSKGKLGETQDAVLPEGQIEIATCDDGELADGSVVQLDEIGEARVLISPSYRQICLRRGRMHLMTADIDPGWPMYVYMGQWCLRSFELEALMLCEGDVIEVYVQFGALSLFKLDAVPHLPPAHCPLPMPAANATEELHVPAMRRVRCSGQTVTVHAITEEASFRIMESLNQ
jgi:ferric-dicitrate binding protein FerR (iron transport regulator)